MSREAASDCANHQASQAAQLAKSSRYAAHVAAEAHLFQQRCRLEQQ